MAIPVIIMGEPGSGKSASLRNFEKEEVSILNVTKKPLPFKKPLPIKHNCGYEDIAEALANPTKRAYVIDDAVLNMAKEHFARALEKGYDKFTEMAKHFYDMLSFIVNEMDDDIIVYLLLHTETDEGRIRVKTLGKMLDSAFGGGIESLVTICLRATKAEDGYKFVTGGEQNSTAKAPMEMFEKQTIDNDLKIVDATIRKYYNMPPLVKGKGETKGQEKSKEEK